MKLLNDAEFGQYLLDCQRVKKPLNIWWIAFLIVLWIAAFALIATSSYAEYSDDQIANAIYKAENSVKYPYGIKSIDTHGDPVYARKICLNTIRNNRRRFAKQTKHTDYIEFLGSRYCPPSAHSLNKHWVKNVRYFLQRGA